MARPYYVYRRPFDYELRNRIRRIQPLRQFGYDYGTSLTLTTPQWAVTGAAGADANTGGGTHNVRRIGVFRKRWNYEERARRVEQYWFEVDPSQTIDWETVTLTLQTPQWVVSTTNDFLVTFTTATLTLTTPQWSIAGARVVDFNPLSLSFTTPSWEINATAFGPEAASVTVRAARDGFFDGKQRSTGDTFAITHPDQYSPYWMTFVDAIPSSWTTFLRVYSADVERSVLRPVIGPEVTTWVDTGIEPQ